MATLWVTKPDLGIGKRGGANLDFKVFIENYSLSIDGAPVEISDLANVISDNAIGKQSWAFAYDGHTVIETPAVQPFPTGLTVNEGQTQTSVDLTAYEKIEFILDTGLGITYKGKGNLLNHTISSTMSVLSTRMTGVIVSAGEPIRRQA